MRINVFITNEKPKKSNPEKKIYFYEKRPKRRWMKLSKFYVLITKAKKFYSGKIPKYDQSQLIKDRRTRTGRCRTEQLLRVVQTKSILFLKSMSERVGSDIERL